MNAASMFFLRDARPFGWLRLPWRSGLAEWRAVAWLSRTRSRANHGSQSKSSLGDDAAFFVQASEGATSSFEHLFLRESLHSLARPLKNRPWS